MSTQNQEVTARRQQMRVRGIKYTILSFLLLFALLVGTGCALLDPSASLSGRTKEAYNCILSSSTLSDMKSIHVLSGRVVSGDLYCYLKTTTQGGRVDYELYRIKNNGSTKAIAVTIYTLTESNYCLAEGYLELNELNDALKAKFESPTSIVQMNIKNFGGNTMTTIITIAVLVVAFCLNGLLASKASDMAENKGYEKKTWFHMCFWLGLISYIIIAAMPDHVMQKKIDQTNKLLEELLKAQKASPATNEHAQRADVGSFLPEL